MRTANILVVDDDRCILLAVSTALKSAGYAGVYTLEEGTAVLETVRSKDIGVVVLDLSLPDSETSLLERLKEEFPDLPVIILTGTNDLQTAVGCMKAGAFDYLVKPVDISRFLATVAKAAEFLLLRNEASRLKDYLLSDRLKREEAFSHIVTSSKKMRSVFQYLEVVAPSRQPVLIIGETGVGKELMARALHNLAGSSVPFVPVNVAGLDDHMFSDTLFGHTKGSFTGAVQARQGLIAQAAGGILFLDEIGDLAPQSQVKLLRLLQEGRYYPIGSDVPRKCDARFVVATNRNLEAMMEEGTFRKDLYYRLRGHQVTIPPLRERLEDLPALVSTFTTAAAESMGKKVPQIPQELHTLLGAYHFPGNVRELQALVFDAVARASNGQVGLAPFRDVIRADRCAPVPVSTGAPAGEERIPTLKEAEERLVKRALEIAGGNQGTAAALLGITRQALNKRLKRKEVS